MPRSPTPGQPILSYPTPHRADRLLVELHSADVASHSTPHPGTPHPDTQKYSGFVFVAEQPTDSEHWVRRVWARDRDAQEAYNAARVQYLAESVAHPIYLRQYVERRPYSPLPRNAPLTGVIFLSVTEGGTGYTHPPTVTILGAGSGASGEAIVFRGEVVGIILTAEGTGYTSAPSVTLSGGGGTGAAATAYIQDQDAVLVAEEESRIDGPLDGLYVQVARTYKTLPGPDLLTRSIGQDNLIPQKFRRLITTTVTETDVAPDEEMPEALEGDQSLVQIKDASTAEAKKTVVEETIDEEADPLAGEYTDEQGVVTTEEELVDEGEPAEEGFQVKSSRVVPLGNGKAVKETDTYPEFPVLVDYEMDTQLWVPREVRKKIVDKITAEESTIETVTEGDLTIAQIQEFKALDKWRSVRIQTRTVLSDSGAGTGILDRAAVIWYGIEQHSFPSVLESVTIASPSTGVSSLEQLQVEVRVREGYSGPVKARYTETFHSTPPAAVEPTGFFPQSFSGHMITRNALLNGVDLGIAVTTIPVRIPSCLHDEIELSLPLYGWISGSGTEEDPYVWGQLEYPPGHPDEGDPIALEFGTIPATNPVDLTPEAWIVKDQQVTRYLGVWRQVLVEVQIPDPEP